MGFPSSAVREASDALSSSSRPLLVSHIDADGIASAAIALRALRSLGKEPRALHLRQLSTQTLPDVVKAAEGRDLAVFCDLGSGQLDLVASLGLRSVVLDHHAPRSGVGLDGVHLNPHLFAPESAESSSGATVAYLVARELGLRELAPLAVVGAVGDLQDRRTGRLEGLDRLPLEDGLSDGSVEARRGLSFFGRETRPLSVLLSYASSPYLPGLTGEPDACATFLEAEGVRARDGERLRTYHDLSPDERLRLGDALVRHCIRTGVPSWGLEQLAKEYYTLPLKRARTELRDATEFATLLNACGRWGLASLGVKVALGEEGYYAKARSMLDYHRSQLRSGLDELKQKGARPVGDHVQLFVAETISPTVVGIVAGMALGSRMVDPSRVILAAARDEGGRVKLSARTTQSLVRSGVDLASALREAALRVGGESGGHDIAAGAYVEEGAVELFALELDSAVERQMVVATRQ